MTPEQLLSEAVKRRIETLTTSLADLTRTTGVSYPTIRNLRDEGVVPTRSDKRAALAAGLGWSVESFDLVKAGHDPVEISEPDGESLDELREAVQAVAETLSGLGRQVADLASQHQTLREEVRSLGAGRQGNRSAGRTPPATS